MTSPGSTSPTATFGTPPTSFGKHGIASSSSTGLARTPTFPPGSGQAASAKHLKPFATEDFKILLLENVNKTGRDALEKQGYQVEFHKSSLPEEELISKIRYVGLLLVRCVCSTTAAIWVSFTDYET